MLELFLDPQVWVSLLTLAALEVVLGIDNVIFLSIVTERLPPERRPMARRIGLGLALLGRLALLGSIAWLIGLTAPVFSILDLEISWRDLILLGGGFFLLAKATTEMHHMLEIADESHGRGGVASAAFAMVLAQIVALDIVFSLDSVLTAIGMVEHIEVMVVAILFAIAVMLLAAEPVSKFVTDHPTVKMLALAFLLLIGVTLVADGLHFHIPRGYLYFAIAFSAGVEGLNLWVAKRRRARRLAVE